jgi:signal transduction histidine kinase
VKQVLLNLLLNAIQASEAAGQVSIRCSTASDQLRIEVVDEGHGIPAEDLDHIFDPFFTTKDNGTGLGLAVAANIVAQHGGTLACYPNTQSNRGMIFRMELPRYRPHASDAEATMRIKAVQS